MIAARSRDDAGARHLTRRRNLANAPRALNEPECCRYSSFSVTCAAPMRPASNTGVRRTCGAITDQQSAIAARSIVCCIRASLESLSNTRADAAVRPIESGPPRDPSAIVVILARIAVADRTHKSVDFRREYGIFSDQFGDESVAMQNSGIISPKSACNLGV